MLRRIWKRPIRNKTSPTSTGAQQVLSTDHSYGSITSVQSKFAGFKISSGLPYASKPKYPQTFVGTSPPCTPSNKPAVGSNTLGIKTVLDSSQVPAAPRKAYKLSSTEALFTQHYHSQGRNSKLWSKHISTAVFTTPTGGGAAAPAAASARTRARASVHGIPFLFQRRDDPDTDSSASGSQHSAIGSHPGIFAGLNAGKVLLPSAAVSVPLAHFAAPKDTAVAAPDGATAPVRQTNQAAATKTIRKNHSGRLSRLLPRTLRSWNSHLSVGSFTTPTDDAIATARTPTSTPMPMPMSSTIRRLRASAPIDVGRAFTKAYGAYTPAAAEKPIGTDLLLDAAQLMTRFNADFDDFAGATDAGIDANGAAATAELPSNVTDRGFGRIKSSHSLSDRLLSSVGRGRSISFSAGRGRSTSRADVRHVFAAVDTDAVGAQDTGSAAGLPHAGASTHAKSLSCYEGPLSTPKWHVCGSSEENKGQAVCQPSPLDAVYHGYEPPAALVQYDFRSSINSWLQAGAQASFMERYDLQLSVCGTDSEASKSPRLEDHELNGDEAGSSCTEHWASAFHQATSRSTSSGRSNEGAHAGEDTVPGGADGRAAGGDPDLGHWPSAVFPRHSRRSHHPKHASRGPSIRHDDTTALKVHDLT